MADELEKKEQTIEEQPEHHEGVHTLADDMKKAKESTGANVSSSDASQPFRTLASDLAHALGEKKGTVVRLALAEEEKRKRLEEGKERFSKQNIFFIATSAIFVVAGIALIIFLYLKKNNNNILVQQSVILPVYILTDNNITFDVSDGNENFPQLLQDVFINSGQVGTVGVYPLYGSPENGTLVLLKDFAKLLNITIPTGFESVFSPYFMLGYSDITNTKSSFVVLKSNSYEAADSILRKWEETMFLDLQSVFINNSISNTNKEFLNAIIHNKDARVVRNEEGEIIFFYVFIDKYTVLFSNNVDIVNVVIDRLNTERLIK